MSTDPTTFAVVGSGRRCRFFLRLAQAAPDRLRAAGVVTRTAERGQEVTDAWGCRPTGRWRTCCAPTGRTS